MPHNFLHKFNYLSDGGGWGPNNYGRQNNGRTSGHGPRSTFSKTHSKTHWGALPGYEGSRHEHKKQEGISGDATLGIIFLSLFLVGACNK